MFGVSFRYLGVFGINMFLPRICDIFSIIILGVKRIKIINILLPVQTFLLWLVEWNHYTIPIPTGYILHLHWSPDHHLHFFTLLWIVVFMLLFLSQHLCFTKMFLSWWSVFFCVCEQGIKSIQILTIKMGNKNN